MSAIGIDDVEGLLGVDQYEEEGEFPVEQGYIWTMCSAVENGNPIFWDEKAAEAVTGGPIAPPTMVSVWFRPHHWAPARTTGGLPLQVHFDLKEGLGLPEAVMTDNTIVFHQPVRPGDRLVTRQILRSVSGEKTTKLGTGRFWVIDVAYDNQRGELVAVESYTGFGYQRGDQVVSAGGPAAAGASGDAGSVVGGAVETPVVGSSSGSGLRRLLLGDVAAGQKIPDLAYPVTATTVVLGALATRDWRPMHHDKDFAVHRNGTRDIFLNTPNQAAWFERYVTDWTGPYGRLRRMTFRMLGSIFPGDTMVFSGTVTDTGVDETGCGWATLDIAVSVDGDPKTTCKATVALPVDDDDNPWDRTGDRWQP